MVRRSVISVIGIAVLLAAAWPLPGYADGGGVTLQPLNVIGQGTINLSSAKCSASGLVCNSGDTCQCVELQGNSKGLGFEDATFDVLLSVDTNSSLNDGTGQQCFAASGKAVLTNGDGDQLDLETAGLACNSPTMILAFYNGSYGAAGGTGDFATVAGAGALSWSDVLATSNGQLQITGNLGASEASSSEGEGSNGSQGRHHRHSRHRRHSA